MKTALYAGSFDPITNGHLDIIIRGSELFDKIVIGVAQNDSKHCLLSVEDRIFLIKECISDIKNAEVCSYEGLTVDFAKGKNINFLLRGIRNTADFEYENQLANNNALISDNIETVFLLSKSENAFITSSSVREVLKYNGNISKFVPNPVQKFFLK